jgi:predicted ferric reductase
MTLPIIFQTICVTVYFVMFVFFICAFFFFGLNLTVGDLNEEKGEESIIWVIKILSFLVSIVLLLVYLYYTQYRITQIALLFVYVFGLGLINHMLGDKIFNYLTCDDNSFTRKFLLSLGLLVLSVIYGSLFWFSWLYLLQV